jgi:cellulose synthase/poly-beta-1,6-N-acetylglucosamine synthase-like glycosyltransferase
MRLARFGYRCGVIDSTTYEEAPAMVKHWLGQRSRWLKGWMSLSITQFLLCFQKLEHASTAHRNVVATMQFVRRCSCTFATMIALPATPPDRTA